MEPPFETSSARRDSSGSLLKNLEAAAFFVLRAAGRQPARAASWHASGCSTAASAFNRPDLAI